MKRLTHILHLEDDALDAELIQVTLESAGIACQINRVQNRDEFTQALQQGEYDIILGDYRLPAYDGVSALRLAQELRPDLPFIFVSGTLGEDAAIDGFTQGATDYVLKQKLSRLAPAVKRALREAENRQERKQAEETLTHERNLLRTLIDHIPDFIYIKDVESRFLIANASVARHMGAASPTELVGRTDWDFYPPERVAQFYADERAIMQSGKPLLDHDEPNVDASGNLRWIMTTKLPMRDSHGQIIGLVGIGHDLTERKQAEQERQAHLRFLASMDQINRAIQGTNELDQLMRDVLDVVLSIFDCDRAWLLYPLEPGIPTWQAPIERTRLDSLDARASGSELPVDPELIHLLRTARDSSLVVQSSPGSEYQVPAEIAKQLNIQSQLAMGVYPKVDRPYLFELQQCSYPRIWTSQEERLFQEIGRRLSDALTSLLIFRNLQESEAKFSTAFRSSPSALSVSTAKNHVYVDVNDSFLQWTGYTQAEVMGHTSIELKLWAEPDQDREFRRLLHEHGSVYNFEYAYRRKDGDVRYALVSATFITIGGEPCVLAQSNDISERKKAEEARKESEEHWQRLVEYQPTGSAIHCEGKIVYANKVCLEVAGANSEEELIGKPMLDFVHPDSRPFVLKRVKHMLETGNYGEPTEEKFLKVNGETIDVEVTAIPVTYMGKPAIHTVFWDITGRKRAEAAVQASEERYRFLYEDNPSMYFTVDAEGMVLSVNRFGTEQLGYSAEEVVGQSVLNVFYPDDKPSALQQLAACLQNPTQLAHWEFRKVRKDGSVLWVKEAARTVRQPDGKLVVLIVCEDITKRKQAEEEIHKLNQELEQRVIDRTAELARAHEHLRAILDTAGEGVVFTDLLGTIEYINPAMERLTGYTTEEALGRNPRLWKSDQTPSTAHQHMWGALLHGEIWEGELINRRKDGTLYDAALTAAPLTNPEGQTVGFVGVQRDITRQKELDRMKDQFVSNVSHELRTPLANILLHIGLLEHGKPDRLASYQQTVRREAERLRKMIEDLLDLSRLDRNVAPSQLAPIDLNQLLEHLVADRATLADQCGLTLTYEPAPDLPLVLTDAPKLIQVASNLLTNALNYTPAGGVVSVWAEERHHEGQKMAAFTVRDTGPGITAQDMPHLFERFYRGAAGRQASAPGTGLGLAISQEIMERLGGRITLESEAGQGAAFTVWLPIT